MKPLVALSWQDLPGQFIESPALVSDAASPNPQHAPLTHAFRVWMLQVLP